MGPREVTPPVLAEEVGTLLDTWGMQKILRALASEAASRARMYALGGPYEDTAYHRSYRDVALALAVESNKGVYP